MDVEFVNQTLLALANPSQGLAFFTRSKQGMFQLRNTQQNLIGATRFVVADSLLRHAVQAMFVPPNILLGAARMAVRVDIPCHRLPGWLPRSVAEAAIAPRRHRRPSSSTAAPSQCRGPPSSALQKSVGS